MLLVNQNMGLRCSHEGLDCSAQRLPRSVTEKTEEVRMSPRVAKGKLKNGREATTSPRRDEREKLMPPQLVVCEMSEFQVLVPELVTGHQMLLEVLICLNRYLRFERGGLHWRLCNRK